jgi:hypothetical protein
MRPKGAAILALVCAAVVGGPPREAIADGLGVAHLDASDPLSWLVKSVCTDAHDLVLPLDPYDGCPAGTGIRKIRSGDPLPYHNIEQGRYQQRDSFPVYDPVHGRTWMIASFDYSPFNRFNLFDGSDGYDVYTLQNGWATIVNTSDGGGYGQTFYGGDCTIGAGWVLFPVTGFLQGGSGTIPIADVYWEQTGQSYPGDCPARYSTDTLTTWEYRRGVEFGGVGGNPAKHMDALISHHGFQPGSRFLSRGHLEVFYFTKEYGSTRWEVWTPLVQQPKATSECRVPANQTYQGVTFVVQYCHDWSAVVPASSPGIPVWPIANTNLLAKPHFDGTVTGAWHALGTSPAGNPINWRVDNSTSARDTRASPIGVRYLRADCGAGSDGRCNGFDEAVYQDIPVSRFPDTGPYAFGVGARTEADRGVIGVAVQQLDKSGKVLWADTIVDSVLPDNGTSPSPGEASSVYLSARFVYKTTTITRSMNTATMRFLISPQTPQTFDILEAWLSAWPMPAPFGELRRDR